MRQSSSAQLHETNPFRQSIRQSGDLLRLIVALGLVVFTLALLAVIILAPDDPARGITVLAVLALGIPFAWLAWQQPIALLLIILFLNASFFRSSALDIRLGFGGFDLIDLLVLGLVGMLAVRRFAAGKFVIPWWPVSAPLLLFMSLALFSAFFALFLQRVSPNYTFNELRPIFYYLMAFATAWTVTSRRHLMVLLVALFAIADLVVAIIIVQQFLGLRNPLIESVMSGAGRTWLLWSVDGISSGFGSVRVVPAGHVLTYTVSIIAFCAFFYQRQSWLLRAFFGGQFLFINIGLLLTYTRAQWIASAVAIILALIVLMVVNKHRIITFMLVALLALMLVLSLFGILTDGFKQTSMSTSSPLMQRFLSIFSPDETLETNSLQWRVFENEEAFQSIAQNPVIGVGLGNTYRGVMIMNPRENVGDRRFARFIHNAYLYIGVKMGFPTLLVFLWFCGVFIFGGWRVYRRMADSFWKPVTFAMVLSFTGLMIWSNTQPNFMLTEGTLFVGIMVGVVMACCELEQHARENALQNVAPGSVMTISDNRRGTKRSTALSVLGTWRND